MIVPADYQKLDPLPEDPEGCVSYGKQTENALCMVSIYPIKPEDAMDFNDTEALINRIYTVVAPGLWRHAEICLSSHLQN